MNGAANDRIHRWDAWLALQPEAAIEPALPIIDPHHHLWDRGGHRYLLDEFAADVRGHHIMASVHVECLANYDADAPESLRPVGETAHVASLRRDGTHAGFCEGIVGAADLALGARVGDVLDAHLRAGGDAFKGIRYVTAWDPSPAIHGSYPTRAGMLREPDVQAGAREVGARGQSLDLWLYFHQLADATALARACPELGVVVNHCGGPIGIGPYDSARNEVFVHWRKALEMLCTCENVSMKIGGLGMALAGFGWRKLSAPPGSDALAEAWRPYVETCIELFGPRRCMFESNFPVDRTGCTGTSLWNAFKKLSSPLRPSERQELFSGTAQRVYRLRG